ncbi:hypothetical protein EKN56_02050 [Limnobaculum zhutongyuii]|uniref:Autotransporter outer membrane beta-barrel domain-containing protein n=1 Tax=Limnobaculum zhutongyuii TaxID=2498113 RepID=A0A411WG61_9GAMM|nr:hypothetical protein [Limnobaculum zhutongyuii]QBH95290.1 hypothetical protein EKN56_02050 [Limnobaculum zhutongyuii]
MSKEKLTVLNRISSPSQKFNKIALSIALLTAGSEVFAQQYILDGPTASGSITGAYTYEGTVNNPAAIAVMNGGKLTTSSSITALPYDLNGYSILVTGANSRIDVINRGLRANLGEAPGSTGLFVSEGTFNNLNSWFVAHTASSNEMTGKVTGIHAISGATVTVEGAQINLFPTRDYANSTLTGTNAILIEHGNSNVQDTTVTTSGQLLIQLQGNEGHGVYVLNDSAIATDAKDGVMRIYGLENAIDIIGNSSYALATGKTTYGTSRIFVGDEQTSAKGTIAITTQGINAHGIVTAPKGEIKLYGDGQTIKTVGAGASDLVSNGGVIDITGDGHQLTTMDAHAVVASGGGGVLSI